MWQDSDHRPQGSMSEHMHRTSGCLLLFPRGLWVLGVWGKCARDGAPYPRPHAAMPRLQQVIKALHTCTSWYAYAMFSSSFHILSIDGLDVCTGWPTFSAWFPVWPCFVGQDL